MKNIAKHQRHCEQSEVIHMDYRVAMSSRNDDRAFAGPHPRKMGKRTDELEYSFKNKSLPGVNSLC